MIEFNEDLDVFEILDSKLLYGEQYKNLLLDLAGKPLKEDWYPLVCTSVEDKILLLRAKIIDSPATERRMKIMNSRYHNLVRIVIKKPRIPLWLNTHNLLNKDVVIYVDVSYLYLIDPIYLLGYINPKASELIYLRPVAEDMLIKVFDALTRNIVHHNYAFIFLIPPVMRKKAEQKCAVQCSSELFEVLPASMQKEMIKTQGVNTLVGDKALKEKLYKYISQTMDELKRVNHYLMEAKQEIQSFYKLDNYLTLMKKLNLDPKSNHEVGSLIVKMYSHDQQLLITSRSLSEYENKFYSGNRYIFRKEFLPYFDRLVQMVYKKHS